MTLPRSLSALLLTATILGSGAPALAAVTDGMDRTVKPGDDFYAYANGGWMKSTEIPADRSNIGSFVILAEQTNQRVAGLLREALKAPAGSEAHKAATYFATLNDQAAIDAQGLAPLAPRLAEIAAIADRAGLARALGGTLRADVDALNMGEIHTENLFGLWVAQDFDKPSYSPFLMQGGLGMPDRDYYLSDKPRMRGLRDQYQAHIASMLHLAGIDRAEDRAAGVLALETKIAQAHWSAVDSRDTQKANNRWSREAFDRQAPGMDWQQFFAAAGLGAQGEFIVWQPSAFTGISSLVAGEPIETWKDWLAFHALNREAVYLPQAFAQQRFSFHGTALRGTPQLRERWKQALESTDAAMADAVGRMYAEHYFPPEAKAAAQAMVKNVLVAFGQRIDGLQWMAPETKAEARAKLATLRVDVGYPDKWRSFSGLEVRPGDAIGNHERAEKFNLRQALDKLSSPIDRGEWVMPAHRINAVNLPVLNALQFPAAILQPPFFDAKAPVARNYGGIGAVIGHEISHSFDDEGAKFDSTGRMRDWWTAPDLARFHEASARLVAQYGASRPLPDAQVNGELTLGENIADVAGLLSAYGGLQLAQKERKGPVVEGFTPAQQFFLNFARVWRTRMREPQLRVALQTDGHAPGEYRADVVRNLDSWYPAFGVKPGQKLYLAPADRVPVW